MKAQYLTGILAVVAVILMVVAGFNLEHPRVQARLIVVSLMCVTLAFLWQIVRK